MPYIYKYEDPDTEQVVYVGISRDYDTLLRRFAAHKNNDPWGVLKLWNIYTAEVKTQSDAEVLEGHFIALYETYRFYNKAKAGWGVCSFVPEIVWRKWTPLEGKNYQEVLRTQREQLRANIYDMRRTIDSLITRQSFLLAECDRINDAEKSAEREAVRGWLRHSFAFNWREWEERRGATPEKILEYYETDTGEWKTWGFDSAEELQDAIADLRQGYSRGDGALMKQYDHYIQEV